MNVLVLEKDKKERKRIIDILKTQEVKIETAKGQKDILKLLDGDNAPQNIVLTEFDIGDIDGFDLINSILATDMEVFPYIIFMIDEDAHQNAVDSLGPIPGDFLVRPFSENELKARLAIAERSLALQNRLNRGERPSEALAIYDQLTGVLNRQAVYERALAEHNRSLRQKLDLSVAMLEVRNLQKILDEHGEQVHDQAVRFMARATRANVRIYDLVGRWIGSKFFIMLPGAPPDAAHGIFERITKSITTISIRLPEGGRIKLDVRIGYTSSDGIGLPPLYLLIEQANDALKSIEQDTSVTVRLYEES